MWLAALLLLLLRGGLELLPESHLLAADSMRVRDFWRLEQGIRERGAAHPRVLLAGSSRVLSMKERHHALALGLPPSAVVHASKLGNGFWDTLTLLRRNPHLVDELELLVMDVYPAQERISERFSENDLLFLRHARVLERWRVSDPADRAVAFADLALPIWSERLRLTEWLLVLRSLTSREPPPIPVAPELLRLQELLGEVTPEERVRLQAEFLFPDTPRSEVELLALRELANLLPERARLLLVWLPFRNDFRRIVSEDEGMRRVGDEFRASLEGFDHPKVETVWIDDQQEIGLADRDYIADGAHFTPPGNAKVLRALVRIERQFLRNP